MFRQGRNFLRHLCCQIVELTRVIFDVVEFPAFNVLQLHDLPIAKTNLPLAGRVARQDEALRRRWLSAKGGCKADPIELRRGMTVDLRRVSALGQVKERRHEVHDMHGLPVDASRSDHAWPVRDQMRSRAAFVTGLLELTIGRVAYVRPFGVKRGKLNPSPSSMTFFLKGVFFLSAVELRPLVNGFEPLSERYRISVFSSSPISLIVSTTRPMFRSMQCTMPAYPAICASKR